MRPIRFGYSLALGLLIACGGCGEQVDLAQHQQLQQQTGQKKIVEQLFTSAIGLLSDVEHADSPDLLNQVVNNLNQWVQTRDKLDDWQLDPLVTSLPAELQKSPAFTNLEKLEFRRGDAFLLQEAIWLRQASRHVAGKLNDPLAKAEALFDWTMRQVALAPANESQVPHAVWETILRGRGEVVDRLWTFALLARQQNLDVVVLAVEREGLQVPWAAGLWHQKQLYVFDPVVEQPIRNAQGKLATLAEIVAEPKLALALETAARPEPRVTADDLTRLVALVEASPPYLAARFRHVELNLVGDDRLVLSTDATALVEQLKASQQVSAAQLWHLPWERVAKNLQNDKQVEAARLAELRPFRVPKAMLWKGRVYHLTGRLTGDESAVNYYQRCRPSSEELAVLKQGNNPQMTEILQVGLIAKQDATYWLGQVAWERGNYPTAIEYFAERLLKATPDTRWKSAAELMIGRAHEAAGEQAPALAAYAQVTGPTADAAKQRAKRLTEK